METWPKMVVKLFSNGLNQELMWKDLKKGEEKIMQEMLEKD